MKKSIRLRLTVLFAAIMAALVLGIWSFSAFFLKDLYENNRRATIVEIEKGLIDSWDKDPGTRNELLVRLSEQRNVSVLVIDHTGAEVYSSMSKAKVGYMKNHLFSYMFSPVTSAKDMFEVHEYYDEDLGGNYFECWGLLPDNHAFLISLPLEAIHESIQIINRYILFIGVGCAILGILAVYFSARRITRPIQELTDLSEEMSRLNFDARYNGVSTDEIGTLGHNFNAMSDTLKKTISELKSANLSLMEDIEERRQIDEMRKEFLSNVSHELKTPIALIQGYAEGLKEGISDDPESMDFYCDVIIDEAAKMNRMVKSLLTLNQLESGEEQVELVRFDISELIAGVLASSDILLGQQQAIVMNSFEHPVFVWGDEFKVEEVLTNYLSNAINHLGGERVIRMEYEEIDEKIRIHVVNSGDPIPEEELEKIWIKFYKVDKARTREYGGSGIGLSIVKAIMDSFHRECGVYNEKNGVNFWFELEKA